MMLIRDIVDVMLDTQVFFKRVAGQSPIRSLVYFGIVSLITLAVNWALLSLNIMPAGLMPFKGMITGKEPLAMLIPLLYFISGFFFIIFYAFLIGRVFRRALFRDAITIVAHGFTPAVLALWIPVIGILFGGWSVYLTALGLGAFNDKTMGENLRACIGSGIVTGILIIMFMLLVAQGIVQITGSDPALIWTALVPV